MESKALWDRSRRPGNDVRKLLALHDIQAAAQFVGILFARYVLEIPLPTLAMLSVPTLLVLLNLAARMRARLQTVTPPAELAVHLAVDMAALTALLYLSGGSTNPFVSLFLLHLAIAAAILPARLVALIALFAALAYTALMYVFIPLPSAGPSIASTHSLLCSSPVAHPAHDHAGPNFRLHILGMWFNFLFAGALIAYFVARLAHSVRMKDQALAASRESILRNERVVALGTFAAGAAHELGTPLSTMAVVTRELQQDALQKNERDAYVAVLHQQIDRCRSILSRMTASAGHARADAIFEETLDDYLKRVQEEWSLLRPECPIKTRFRGDRPAPRIGADPSLSQAIMNLLNNAADVSPAGIEWEASWTSSALTMEIRDDGPGLTDDIASRAGEACFTTKGDQGLGIGLFLANASIEHLGGSVVMFNRPSGGACVQITLPLKKLALD